MEPAGAAPWGLNSAAFVVGLSPSSGSGPAVSGAVAHPWFAATSDSPPVGFGGTSSCAGSLFAATSAAAAAALVAIGGRRRLRPRGREVRWARQCGSTGILDSPVANTATADLSDEKVKYVKSLFKDVLESRVPRKLDVFLIVVQNSGYNVLGRDEWKSIGGDMHPFILPLATKGEGDDLEVMGLLIRTPNGAALQPEEYHVVSQKPRRSNVVHLIAMDMDKYIMKRAEEATFENEKKDLPIIEATADIYEVRFKGTDRNALDRWLLLNVGAFPDVYSNLIDEHIQNDDAKTGLIIADTMRDTFGTTWGFPHAYCCRVLRDHFNFGKAELENRDLEADHCAQRCFTTGLPLWTLEEDGDSLQDLLLEARMPSLGSVDALRVFYLKRATDEQRAAVRTGSISLGCATLAKGQALLDAVCCGHKSYKAIRPELRDLYEEVPGCDPLVNLIDYFSTSGA